MNIYDFHDRVLLLRTQAAEIRARFGFPTFATTLDIPRARMWDQTLEAMAIGEVYFQDWRYPDTREAVLACLNAVIHNCNELGIPFPAVLLLRQRQLTAGEFPLHRTSAPLFQKEEKT